MAKRKKIILKEQIKNIQHERELEKELIEKEGKEEESKKIFNRTLKTKSRMINSLIEILKSIFIFLNHKNKNKNKNE